MIRITIRKGKRGPDPVGGGANNKSDNLNSVNTGRPFFLLLIIILLFLFFFSPPEWSGRRITITSKN